MGLGLGLDSSNLLGPGATFFPRFVGGLTKKYGDKVADGGEQRPLSGHKGWPPSQYQTLFSFYYVSPSRIYQLQLGDREGDRDNAAQQC